MNKQKKPLYWYYFIVLIILLLLDFVFIPMYTNSRIEETSYSSFLNQIELCIRDSPYASVQRTTGTDY